MIPTHSPRRGLAIGLAVTFGCVTVLALLAGSLYLFYGSEGSCEEDKAVQRMAQVSAAVPAAAAGTTPVAESSGVECMDDSGDPWVTADSIYTHDGDVRPLVTHYWDTAAKDGWKAPGPRARAEDGLRGSGICFRKEVAGEPALLRVSSIGPTRLAVSVESALDGSALPC